MSAYLAELKSRIPETVADALLESYLSQATQDVRNARGYLEEDTDWIVTAEEMFNGEYSVSGQPSVPTIPSITHESVGETDTLGTITITGTNRIGSEITDEVTPVADSTVYGTKTFYSITSVLGENWIVNGEADILTVGISEEATEARWKYSIIDLAEAYYNKRGAEGEKSHSEGDIDRVFSRKTEILSQITSIARAI